MKTTKHPPGPWKVVETPTGLKPPYLPIRHSVHDTTGQEVAGVHRWTGKWNEANARLIAAAPDLLAAAEHARDAMLEPDIDDQDALDSLERAIAKAQGTEQSPAIGQEVEAA